MNQETFDPAVASGESAYRGVEPLILNQVSLNGDADTDEVEPGKFVRKGGFFRKTILVGATKDEKPEEHKLGEQITIVMLKVRRKLVERGDKGKIVRQTSEHNSKRDAVALFHSSESGKAEREEGVAEDLRAKYPGLRTVQIVYALLCEGTAEPELVRLIVKGASLGSESKAETTTDFYKYLNSFTGEDHFYQFKTNLVAVLEKGAKSYFAIDFKRGDRLSEKAYNYAMDKLFFVFRKCDDADKARLSRMTKAVAPEVEEAIPEELPADDISPDDIPF